MMKKLLLTTAVGGLMMSAAFAQAPNPTPPASNPPPAATAPAPSGTQAAKPADQSKAAETAKPADKTASAADTSQPKFIDSQGTDKFVFSKFNGTDVVGPDNKKIGDISDVLFDKDHKIVAYIVGVGGFLGIGQKNVAVDPSAFQPWHDPNDKNAAADDPNNMKLKVSWTKDQLQSAPDFKYYKAPSTTASSGGSTTGSSPMGGGRAR